MNHTIEIDDNLPTLKTPQPSKLQNESVYNKVMLKGNFHHCLPCYINPFTRRHIVMIQIS